METKLIQNYFGFNVNIATKDGGMCRDIERKALFEPHLIKFMERLLQPGDVCLDIGACLGIHTLFMSRLVGSKGQVYCFEPQKDIFSHLLIPNIVQNDLENVTAYKKAISDKDQEMYTTGFLNTGNNTINIGTAFVWSDPNRGNTGKVSCVTLDSLEFEKLDFIKLDCQGTEKMVLEGGRNTFKTHKPIVVIEIEENCCECIYNYKVKDLYDAIRSLDYYIFYLEHSYPADHVCVHKDKLEEFRDRFKLYIFPHTENNLVSRNLENGVVEKVKMLV